MSKIWFVIVAVPFMIAALIVNIFLTTDNQTLEERASNASLAGNYSKAESIYSELLKQHPDNVEFHRNNIRNHFDIPKRIGKTSTRDDKKITDYYSSLSWSKDAYQSDLGYYCRGFIQLMLDNKKEALSYYLLVKNADFPYLNNSIGYVYLQQKKYAQAEQYFLNEINAKTNLEGAYSNLAKLYYESAQSDKLNQLLTDPAEKTYIPNSIYRHHYLKSNNLGLYSQYAFKIGDVSALGIIGALLILVVWLIFLRWIDVFETEKIVHMCFALMLSCSFSMLTTPLYDIYEVFFKFSLRGTYLNDFLFSVFGIGIIEETVKIIPFLIILRFKYIVNESTDYIIYASICGLGFAFMENINYFHAAGLDQILSRALSATILHMALTSFAVYGLLYAEYRAKAFKLFYFILSFFCACMIHGIYDFWLISDGWIGELKIFSFLILIYVIQRYLVAIVNSLNQSEFNEGSGISIRTAEFLIISVTLIAVYQYIILGYLYGAENANINLLMILLGPVIIAFILITTLGQFSVSKSRWISIINLK